MLLKSGGSLVVVQAIVPIHNLTKPMLKTTRPLIALMRFGTRFGGKNTVGSGVLKFDEDES